MAPHQQFDSGPVPLATQLERVKVLMEMDPRTAPAEVVREAVLLHAEVGGRLEAEASRWMGVFDAGCLGAADGARTSGAWVKARTELSPEQTAAKLRTARDLRSCPHIEQAQAGGLLGQAKVNAMLAARKVHPALFAEQEAELVAYLIPLTVNHARIAMARWRDLAEATKAFEDAQNGIDPDGAPVDPEPPADPAEQNRLRLGRSLNDRVVGEFDLDPVSGSELDEAINAEIDAKFNQGIYRSDDGLLPGRRRADSLVDLALRGAKASTRQGDPRPSVSARIDPLTLGGFPAESLADGLSRDCCLDDGTPIDARSLERLLCTCRVQALWIRIQENGEVETLGVTDLLRDANRAQRRALKQRDGRCIFPGCSAIAEWCEAHHLHPHEDLGPTLLHNLVLLCRYHHHLVHEGGWTLWRDPTDQQLHLTNPTGTHVPLVAHGLKVDPTALPLESAPRPPPPPPHLRPPRFRTAHDPPPRGQGTTDP